MASQSTLPPAPPGRTLRNLLDTSVKVKTSPPAKGSKALLDSSLETCWTAQSGATLTFTFSEPVRLRTLHALSFTFAGGFAPTKALLSLPDETQIGSPLFPHDSNAKQFFSIDTSSLPDTETSSIRLQLLDSTDEYQRITVYNIELYA